MFRLARSVTGSADDADDVVQDVFLGLPHAIRGFEERCELEEWLRRVSLLRARMLLRSRRRRRELPLPDDGGHPLLSSATSIDGIALERAISSLPACYQTVVLLKEWVGLSHREIADELGITVNTSCVRLCRARRMLRELL